MARSTGESNPHARDHILVSSRQKAVRVYPHRLRELVRFVARAEGRHIEEIDLAVVDSPTMRRLHRRHLGQRGDTDVLSFDLSESAGVPLAGQIVVCGDVAARVGPRHGLTPWRELMLYVVHGLLHLTGYDDLTPADAERMAARQEELLAEFIRPRRR